LTYERYFQNHNIFVAEQYGYRRGLSKTNASHGLTEIILSTLNNNICCMWKYVEIKCQLDATEVFIADFTACSTCFRHHYAHHQELKSIIQWLLTVGFCAVVFKLLVWCGAEGYVSGLQDAGLPASCSNHCIILLSS